MKHMRSRFRGSRWSDPGTVGVTAGFMLVYSLGLHGLNSLLDSPQVSLQDPTVWLSRHLLADANDTSSTEGSTETSTLANEKKPDPLFPEDLFSEYARRHGALALHILGVIYMFVALAIVCDEFFVPSLDVIIEKLAIQDDVAGATFMAAGGSAPELFTSVIGVFVSFDDVGIGTIVGSAVFNILFVIGMCALFSKTVLNLTWWPLFRDCSFYSISLLCLVCFFLDSNIYWWEALLLLGLYGCYVSFMKFNQQVEKTVKRYLNKNKVTRVRSTDQLMPNHQGAVQALHGAATSSSQSSVNAAPGAIPGGVMGPGIVGATRPGAPMLHSGSKFRHGLLQLMIHTIDPMHDGKVDEKATQLHAIASLKVLLDATRPQNGAVKSHLAATTPTSHMMSVQSASTGDAMDVGMMGGIGVPHHSGRSSQETELTQLESGVGGIPTGSGIDAAQPNGALPPGGVMEEEEDEPEPLDMSWPKTCRKRITYVLVAPLIIPLWLTLPDTRKPRGKKFFPITFLGSIIWIAAFSYLMVWWAKIIGDTIRIPPEVMGLTFLAAGTSIPDLITSVIVARKGLGDMAVSSSVGSNIFDVCVGLPLPWLIYGIINSAPVTVNSKGMACSIIILFCMLVFVILSIMCFRWRMNKGLGVSMFLLYFVFVAVSLSFEYKYIKCPL